MDQRIVLVADVARGRERITQARTRLGVLALVVQQPRELRLQAQRHDVRVAECTEPTGERLLREGVA